MGNMQIGGFNKTKPELSSYQAASALLSSARKLWQAAIISWPTWMMCFFISTNRPRHIFAYCEKSVESYPGGEADVFRGSEP